MSKIFKFSSVVVFLMLVLTMFSLAQARPVSAASYLSGCTISGTVSGLTVNLDLTFHNAAGESPADVIDILWGDGEGDSALSPSAGLGNKYGSISHTYASSGSRTITASTTVTDFEVNTFNRTCTGSPLTVTAAPTTFRLAYDKLIINNSGKGTITFSSPSTANHYCSAACSGGSIPYPYNEVVSLHAEPDSTSTFSGWDGDCTGSADCVVRMTQDRNIYAKFTATAPTYFSLSTAKATSDGSTGTVTSTSTPSQTNQINCGSNCATQYPVGATVALTATPTPNTNSKFVQWEGDPDCSDGSVTMNADHLCIARFAYLSPPPPSSTTYNLKTIIVGSGQVNYSPSSIDLGNVCAGTCTQEFYAGNVTLTSTPANGYIFAGWNGSGCSGTGSCVINMNESKTVTATFKSIYVDLYAGECKIKIGESTCWANVRWNTTGLASNPEVTKNNLTATQKTPLVSSDSYGSLNSEVNFGQTTFYLYYNAQILAQRTINIDCETGASWVGGKCIQNSGPSPISGPFTVTATAGSGGDISPSSRTVNYGESASFTITPASGYHIADISDISEEDSYCQRGNTSIQNSLVATDYVTGPIVKNCTVRVNFAQNPSDDDTSCCGVTVIAGPGGTVSGGGSNSQTAINIHVDSGSRVSFDANPDPGYHIDYALAPSCASRVGQGQILALSGNTYSSAEGIVNDCSIYVAFATSLPPPPPPPAPVTSGTLDGNDCQIPLNQSSCTTSLTLAITNPVSDAQTNITKAVPAPNTVVATGITPATKTGIVVTYPSTTFYLNHNSDTLDSKMVNASCYPNVWDGTKCISSVVNGACGPTTALPSHYLCSSGTSINNTENTSTYTWTCKGSDPAAIAAGGTSMSCSETKTSCTNGATNPPTCNVCTPPLVWNPATSSCTTSQTNIDLTALDLSASNTSTLSPTFSASIVNNGSTPATGTITHLFQYDNDDGDRNTVIASDTVVTTSPISSGAGYAPVEKTHTFGAAGTYYVRVCADKRNQNDVIGVILETNDNNNCGNWSRIILTNGSGCSNGATNPPACNEFPPSGPVCGNHILESGEECDLGSSNGNCATTCSSTCRIKTPTCQDGSGGVTVNLTANPAGPFNVTGSTTLYWTITGTPDSCTTSGYWGTAVKSPVNGSQATGVLGPGIYDFTFSCTKGTTTTSDTVAVVVNTSVLRTGGAVDINADPINLKPDKIPNCLPGFQCLSTWLTWTSPANAATCRGVNFSAGGATNRSLPGLERKPSYTTDYSVECYDAAGASLGVDTVKVLVTQLIES